MPGMCWVKEDGDYRVMGRTSGLLEGYIPGTPKKVNGEEPSQEPHKKSREGKPGHWAMSARERRCPEGRTNKQTTAVLRQTVPGAQGGGGLG